MQLLELDECSEADGSICDDNNPLMDMVPGIEVKPQFIEVYSIDIDSKPWTKIDTQPTHLTKLRFLEEVGFIQSERVCFKLRFWYIFRSYIKYTFFRRITHQY